MKNTPKEKSPTTQAKADAKKAARTLTGIYNVLNHLRDGDELSPQDMEIRDQGDIDTLLALHEELDAAVAESYGWPSDLSDDEIIQLLFDLNQQRVGEEAEGQIRWLRQDRQNN